MPWRWFFAILAVLNYFLGVPLVIAQDKSFYETFEKIGHGDFDKGLNHVWQHANDGNGTATLLLSKLFLEFGDLDNFEKYLNISAEQSNPVAMKILGVAFLKGSLDEQNFDKAKIWFEEAARYRNINSMVYLGIMHRDGLGIDVDFTKSYFWFSLAGILKTSAPGDKEPEEFAEELKEELTDAQIIEVGKETHAWLDKHPAFDPQVIPPL